MEVSIIIVNYHSAQMIIDCVKSIRAHTAGLQYEILVVDNGSTNEELAMFSQQLGESIRLIPAGENLGFGKANNLGASQASGKYLFLLNPDTILMNNAVKILFDYLEANPKTGIVGGNLYSPDGNPTGSYCLHFDDPAEEIEASKWGSILRKKLREKSGRNNSRPFASSFNYSNSPIPVAYIFGADMMLSRGLFEECGGFDPEFFMYAEEEELTWRIHEMGYQVVCVPAAKIIHLEGATQKSGSSFSERQFRMRMNGKLIFYKKCYGAEGMETFYRYRCRLYRRLVRFAQLRGRQADNTQAYRMLNCLQDEYQKYTQNNSCVGEVYG